MDPATVIQAVLNGVLIASIYALLAMGLAVVWGVMNIVNFAHGNIMMLSMYLTYWLYTLLGTDPLITAPAGFGLGYLLGVAIYKGVIRRVLGSPLVSQIFATFALLIILENGALLAWGPDYRLVKPWYGGVYLDIAPGLRADLPRLIALAFSLAALAIYNLFLTRTRTGIAIRATAQDGMASSLMGIDRERIYEIAMGVGSGLAGLAGSLLAMYYPVYPSVASYFTLVAYVIVVLGGFGSIAGAFLGSIIVGVIEQLGSLLISPSLRDFIVFLMFLTMLMARPRGLLGKGL